MVLYQDFNVRESRNKNSDHLEADMDLPEGEEMDAARLWALGGSLSIENRAVCGIRHDAEGAHIASILDCKRKKRYATRRNGS